MRLLLNSPDVSYFVISQQITVGGRRAKGAFGSLGYWIAHLGRWVLDCAFGAAGVLDCAIGVGEV
jgi:hypothetical protein